MIPNVGSTELLVILVVALLLFGAKQIPEIARALGRSVNSFKAGLRAVEDDARPADAGSDKDPE